MNEPRSIANISRSMIRTSTRRKYCRNDLYLSDDSGYHGCTMPDILDDLIHSTICGVDCKGSTDDWLYRARCAEIEINGEDYIISDHCLFIGTIDKKIVVMVVSAEGISTCGYQLTYDMIDNYNLDLFMGKTHINEDQYCKYESLLYGVLHLIRLHQIRAYEIGSKTESVIYTNNPKCQELKLSGEGYVAYEYFGFTNRKLLSDITINNVACARFKGISEEAISRVYPEDLDARLMVRDLTELEIAQINALEPELESVEA